MALTDEEYWKKSTLGGFNFDDDIPEEPTTSLSPSETSSEPIFSSSLQNNAVLPTHAIISKRGLDIILQDTRLPSDIRTYSTEETIKKLFLGLPCLLDNYRSLEQKLDLLAKAVDTADGNVILKVVLYLEKTLKTSLLHLHLQKYKLALVHYCNYLATESKYQELNFLYMAVGNNNDMINSFYFPCQYFTSRKRTQSELEKFLNESGNLISDYNKNILQSFKTFIEWQKTDTINKSASVLLAHLYKQHYENNYPQQDITSFCNTLKLSSAQHDWILLNIMAVHKIWDKLTETFVKPSLFKKKVKSSVNIESILNALYRHDAPKKVLEQFLNCIGDNDKGLQLGRKMQCHSFVINKLIENRDRLGLMEYRKYVPSQSEEFFHLEKNLCSDRKWKN